MLSASVGLYKKKVIFFILILAVLGGFFVYYKNQTSQASTEEVIAPQYIIDLQSNGDVILNGTKRNDLMHQGREHDELRFKITDNSDGYIPRIKVVINLPKSTDSQTVKSIIYAEHGVDSYTSELVNSTTIEYFGYGISSQAGFTIVADFSKGYLQFNWFKKTAYSLLNMSGKWWLIISLLFPILALSVLAWMSVKSLKSWKMNEVNEEMATPPNDLSPAIAGILMKGKITSRILAATMLDLARRGYIEIIEKEDKFIFGRRFDFNKENSLQSGLRSFEKILLSKIFQEDKISSSVKDIQVRIGNHIFSRKIADVYVALYNEVTARGFFYQNPSWIYNKFYAIGLSFFFIGLVGFIFGIFVIPEPKFLLLVWFGLVLGALIILKLTPYLPTRTQQGQNITREWLKFKNYLNHSAPIDYQGSSQELFEKYLPYAIAFECEDTWATRFLGSSFRIPDWFTSNKTFYYLEDFANSFFPVIGQITEDLASAKEPIIR